MLRSRHRAMRSPSSSRVYVCAGLTLGKLNAVGWRGTVRQPARSTSNNREAHLDTATIAQTRRFVAQVSKPAVSPTSKSAGRGNHTVCGFVPQSGRDTADLEVCATGAVSRCARKSAGSSAAFVISNNFLIIQISSFSKRTARQLALKVNHLQVATRHCEIVRQHTRLLISAAPITPSQLCRNIQPAAPV